MLFGEFRIHSPSLRSPQSISACVREAIRDDLFALANTVDDWGIWENIPPEWVDAAKAIGHQLSLHALADFDSRIVGRMTSLPVSLLCFAKNRPDIACEDRRNLSGNLLKNPEVHPTATKLVRTMPNRVCARSVGSGFGFLKTITDLQPTLGNSGPATRKSRSTALCGSLSECCPCLFCHVLFCVCMSPQGCFIAICDPVHRLGCVAWCYSTYFG